MKRQIVETTWADGPAPGFKEYGGVRLTFDCGHKVQLDGGFPVPVLMPGEEYECATC